MVNSISGSNVTRLAIYLMALKVLFVEPLFERFVAFLQILNYQILSYQIIQKYDEFQR